jgi:nitroimidazol reductase NimA-like FMN-containing flavoprotein (pyridoxamine 5'-phosphate oxidase superfamily)
MDDAARRDIQEILEAGKDLTVATLREDGWPQATTVGYASDGLAIFFGCGAQSQKARNLARDDRMSATITLPYAAWNEIRGVSVGGRARRVSDPAALARAGALFMRKFGPEIAQYVGGEAQDLAMFEVVPAVFSLLDYRQGFGHTQLIAAA